MQRLTTPRSLDPKGQPPRRSLSTDAPQGAAGSGALRRRREAIEWTEARSEISHWMRQR